MTANLIFPYMIENPLSLPLKSYLFDFSILKGTKILQRVVLCMQKHFFPGSYKDLIYLEYFTFIMFLQKEFFQSYNTTLQSYHKTWGIGQDLMTSSNLTSLAQRQGQLM